MLNILKKNKEQVLNRYDSTGEKQRPLTESEEIAYEVAKGFINDVGGILSRHTYWLRKIGKDQSEVEKARITWIKERIYELGKEEFNLNIYNEPLSQKIKEVYGALLKVYHAMPESDSAIAEKGLPDTFVTTKIDYSEFEVVQREER